MRAMAPAAWAAINSMRTAEVFGISTGSCLARFRQDTPCWEIAKEKSDYRHIMQICVDCIVYMLKGKNTVLSKNEIQSIMVQKANCVLTRDECQTTF